MSYTVYPYLVDLTQLRTIYGCRDTSLLTTLEEEHADQLHEDDEDIEVAEWMASFDEPDGNEPVLPTLRQALQEIIAGTVSSAAKDGPYWWFAYELLCNHFGTELPNEQYLGIRSSALGILEQIEGLQDLVQNSRKPLPFPLPLPADFPSITYLTRDEAAAMLARLPVVVLSAPYDDHWAQWDEHTQEVWLQEGTKRKQIQFQGWLEESARANRDLVAFLY